MKWTLRKLDELGYVSRGRSRHRPRDAPHLYNGPYPFIQTADVKHARLYVNRYSQTYSEEGLAQSRLWKAGTLCITIAANIADTAILGIDACFPDSVIGFIADDRKADTRFVKYLFDAVIQERLKQFTQGVAQDNLSNAKLLSLRFSAPEVEHQRRIADVLSCYDDLIENNRQRIRVLEQAARLIYEEWFVRLRFPGHERVPITDGVPRGWKKKRVIDVADVLSGGTPKTAEPDYWDGDIPFFTSKDAVDGVYVFDTDRTITPVGLRNCNSKLYPKDTVFVTARGTVGKVNLAQTDMAMNQSCYALLAKQSPSQHYLYFSLVDGVQELRGRAVGAIFDAVVRDTFKAIILLVPNTEMVQMFSDHISTVLRQVDVVSHQTRTLVRARDLLLPRLMNRELEP